MTNLEKFRRAKGFTRERLGELSGVSYRNIENYEQGRTNIRKATIEKILSLAKALECDINDLIVGTDEKI